MASAPSSPLQRCVFALRLVAVLALIGTAVYWQTAGAHRGWSQNKIPVQKTDEVTGIAYIVYEDRFVPGLDVLAAGLGTGVSLLIVTFFLRPRSTLPRR